MGLVNHRNQNKVQPKSGHHESIFPKKAPFVGNTRQEAAIIHGHSVKSIERVVYVYEKASKTSRYLDVKEETKRDLVSGQNQLCFVHIFLILDALYICYQKGDFPTVVVMKKCTNHSSFSLF